MVAQRNVPGAWFIDNKASLDRDGGGPMALVDRCIRRRHDPRCTYQSGGLGGRLSRRVPVLEWSRRYLVSLLPFDVFEDFNKEIPMRTAMRWLLSAALVVTAVSAMAQAPLNFNDLVGKWNLMYEDGQSGTFTFSKNDDGTPKVVVSTMAGGESAAKNIVIKGDTITFTRDITAQGLSGSVTYTAKLADGALKGSGDVKLGGPDGAVPGGTTPTPFTATKAK